MTRLKTSPENYQIESSPLLIEGDFQAPLSLAIKTEYNKLITEILGLKSELQMTKTLTWAGGPANITDIISYQIGWGKLLVSWYEAGIEKRIVEMPGEGFEKWDYTGLALHFYKKYHYPSRNRQCLIFYDTAKRIIDIVEEAHNADNLDTIGVWNWCSLKSGKEWPLSKWVQVNTVTPYKRALRLIKTSFAPRPKKRKK